MRSLIILLTMIVGLVGNANGAEIQTTMTEVDGNTMITCIPSGDGEVEKAYISLYVSDGQELFINRREMEVSYDNVATYELAGTRDTVEGKCKFIMSEGDIKITREEFSLSMN